jgi:hypothetical protein
MIPLLQSVAGVDNVKETKWKTGAEDFYYHGTKAPSFFFTREKGKKEEIPKLRHHTIQQILKLTKSK